ncbi:hypothetical protein CGZ75_23960 [Paenibacillus herberti]|uniref:Uncharacterized protein n=1 Tax=Paenibacillus herberti TaxID=1619309 RepID=A0A229NU21_9BACL|nr:hypothetical protein CGZ75_23960 [Paenibacillus herberti]
MGDQAEIGELLEEIIKLKTRCAELEAERDRFAAEAVRLGVEAQRLRRRLGGSTQGMNTRLQEALRE